MQWGGTGKARSVAFCLLLLTLSSVPASSEMLKLLGGAMTWEANPEFLLGAAKRTVTFHLRTSWALGETAAVPGCPTPFDLGTTVGCTIDAALTGSEADKCDPLLEGDGCAVAEKFGVLCVAQLVRDSAGKMYAKYSDPNAQCVTETNVHHSSKLVGGSYNQDLEHKPKVRSGSTTPITIGIPNKLTVQQAYTTDIEPTLQPASAGRKPPASVVLTGTLSHTVLVEEDVSEVVAWLAPRTGFANYKIKTGLLMPACSDHAPPSTTPCMYNECSLQRISCDSSTGCQGAAFRPTSTTDHVRADPFWNLWGDASGVQGCGSGKACLRQASPALEAFVPLCSNDASSVRKCAQGVNNYYSPVTSIPDLIEVAITPLVRLGQAWKYRGHDPYNPAITAVSYDAPHQAFRVQSFDYDGQQMTQYSPQLISELKAGGSGHKMGAGDMDVAAGRNPSDSCPAGDVCCTKPAIRSMRVDCVSSDTPPSYIGETVGHWPTVDDSNSGGATTSGCNFIYDFDRDPLRQQGNLIKPDFPFSYVNGGNRFTQHVLNTVDFPFRDMDNPRQTANHILNSLINHQQSGQGIVQNIFSMFGCDAGTENQPPTFVRGLCDGASLDSCPDSTEINVDTTHECPFWEDCTIHLFARDFTMSTQGVDGRKVNPVTTTNHQVHIQYALGYDHLPLADLEPALGASREADCCVGVGHFKYFLKPAADQDSVTGFFSPLAIGKIYVRCFVAYDVFKTDMTAADQKKTKSCPSMPLCIKIRITGSKPKFVAPTPLGTSFDDNGVLVPNRHDFPACQGYPMKMQLTVQDSMPQATRDMLRTSPLGLKYLKDLKYRIFIEDKDVGFNKDLPVTKSSYDYLKPGGVGNLDFFSTVKLDTSDEVKNKCGDFNGYGAKREGNNFEQDSPNPLAGEGSAKSVMSSYRAGTVENCQCSQVPCSTECPAFDAPVKAEASVAVTFESNPDTGNGVSLRQWPTCVAIDVTNGLEYEVANCREKLTNMDQVICAVGFDNARSVYKRWVGERDPNGDDINNWLRDHSNGDQASEMHCFRILIAAPPVFVTDPSGSITPFSSEKDDNLEPLWKSIVDTTGVRAAYKTISFRVGQTRELIFLAQDPNPSDAVEIFILADPGIPKGMEVGLSDCIMRAGENSMCKADDQITRGVYPNEDWSATFSFDAASRCSRAKRRVTWTPGGDVAGQTFKVCAVARDDSNQCYGTVPEFATQRGWFGEQQCVIINVLRLLVNWGGDFVNLGEDEWTMKAYVGCEFKFHLEIKDSLADAGDAADEPYPLVALLQDTGLQHLTTRGSGTSLDATWVPGRGMEGKSFHMCFGANDLAGILSEPSNMVCRGGSKHLEGCYADSDCGGGVCQRACVRMEVQRCEYCVKGTDTLTWMMRYFGIETNWMRLWALNSYETNTSRTLEIQGAIFPAPQQRWVLNEGSSIPAYITDPDVIMSSDGVQRVLVGSTYRAVSSDKLLALAARFRTTVKTLMAMNPDVNGDEDLVNGTQSLCVLPCSSPGM